MEQPHVTSHIIETHTALVEVDIQADSLGITDFQERLHTGVPGEEASAVPPHAPGEVVPGDAAGALLSLAIDALVRDPDVCPLPAQLCFDVMPPLVQAVRSHRLAPVLEASRVGWVAVLPGAGVGQLSVVLPHAEEVMGGVRVKGQTPFVCNTKGI